MPPQKNSPMMLETAIICATVGIMCPLFFIQPLTRTIFRKIFVKKSKEYSIENEKELIEDTETIPEDIK